METLKDFPPGPLDVYRKQASFDWKKLKVLIDTEDVIIQKQLIVDAFKSDPVLDNNEEETQLDAIRISTLRKSKALSEHDDLQYITSIYDPLKLSALIQSLAQWNAAVAVREGVKTGLFSNAIRALGTEEHQHLAYKADSYELLGCFALTEIGHGSNTKMMQTRATYDRNTKEFVIHSPNFEAAKCWSGLAGQCATHTVLYAQLYTPDGVCHGLHQFVVEIRDPKTHLPPPGVLIADMGPKIGLNGVDNGVIMFDNHRVPKSALLNKNCNVTDDGIYVPKIKDPKKRFGTALNTITTGRFNVACISLGLFIKSITIAVRYSAVRRQFAPENSKKEMPVLEYQLQQYRLLPYLAGAIIHQVGFNFLMTENISTMVETISGNPREDAPERGVEMHAISAACKSFCSWFHRDGMQECREGCGGHGYLKAARLGEMRSDNDVSMTYEGENNVIIQQTSNWLMKFWPMVAKRQRIETPYQSVYFLNDGLRILSRKSQCANVEQMNDPQEILNMYEWLVCYLMKTSIEKFERNLARSGSAFASRNDNQIFYAKDLTLAYIKHFFLHRFLLFINEVDDVNIKAVLKRVFALYGLFNMEHLALHLYKGSYFTESQHGALFHEAILASLDALKNDAVALVDVIAPHDYLLNSMLGNSDGEVYQHLKRVIFTGKDNFKRPDWWQEIIFNNKSKL